MKNNLIPSKNNTLPLRKSKLEPATSQISTRIFYF